MTPEEYVKAYKTITEAVGVNHLNHDQKQAIFDGYVGIKIANVKQDWLESLAPKVLAWALNPDNADTLDKFLKKV